MSRDIYTQSMTYLPPETPEAAAARAALYRKWLTTDDIAGILGVSVNEVRDMRRRRELLSVWVHEKHEYRFPKFQLYEGKPNVRMPALLRLLSDVSRSGWGWIEWFISCRTLLSGAQPADLIAKGRFDEVLAAAEEEAAAHPDANW
jgi:hypothetical protein